MLETRSSMLNDPARFASETRLHEPGTTANAQGITQNSAAIADSQSAGESCPPPLAWPEVVAAYRSQSTPWELSNGSRHLVGRTWGNGLPLYFLNGFAATAEMSSLTLWLLKDQFRCIVFDTHDDRAARTARPRMSDFTSDLFAAADLHEDRTLRVFGPSFGAAVALAAAREIPERFAGIVLQHGFSQRRLSVAERMLSELCGLTHFPLSSFPGRRRIQELNHRRWFPPFDTTRFEFLIESTGSLRLADLAGKAMALAAFDLTEQLHEVTCPILLLRTEGESRVETQCQLQLERGLKQSRTEWMHSAGQHPCLTHPHRLAKVLKSFFPSDLA